MADDGSQSHKAHRAPRAGPKAAKKEAVDKKRRGLGNERYNPRAFTFNNPQKQVGGRSLPPDKLPPRCQTYHCHLPRQLTATLPYKPLPPSMRRTKLNRDIKVCTDI